MKVLEVRIFYKEEVLDVKDNIISIGMRSLKNRLKDTTNSELKQNLSGKIEGMNLTVNALISEIEERLSNGDDSLKSFLEYLKW